MLDLTSEVTHLAERIVRLERLARRQRAVLTAVLISALVFGTLVAANPLDDGIVRAKGLVVSDADGKARIAIGVGRAGPSLELTDADGGVRVAVSADGRQSRVVLTEPESGKVTLTVSPAGNGLTVGGTKGQRSVEVSVREKDHGLTVWDAEARPRAELIVREDVPTFSLRDPAAKSGVTAMCGNTASSIGLIEGGKLRLSDIAAKNDYAVSAYAEDGSTCSLGATKAGTRLVFRDPKGAVAAGLTVGRESVALRLHDPAGKPRVFAYATDDFAGLGVNDAAGKGRLELEVGRDGPVLQVKDADGKATFSKP